MKVDDYVTLGINLCGYGRLDNIALDTRFFMCIEQRYGEIAEVLPFIWGFGGLAFSRKPIEGCAIKLVDGGVVSIQSDGKYVDFSYVKGDKKKR